MSGQNIEALDFIVFGEWLDRHKLVVRTDGSGWPFELNGMHFGVADSEGLSGKHINAAHPGAREEFYAIFPIKDDGDSVDTKPPNVVK